MSNHTTRTRTGSFSARSASATRTNMTLDAGVHRTPAERSVRQPRCVIMRADHDELGSSADRHRDSPSLGAGLLSDRLLDRERLDHERQPAATEQRGQRVEPGIVCRRGRERARIVDQRR